jgi:serine phosphatase RsbU (regulator of sigma subunit)
MPTQVRNLLHIFVRRGGRKRQLTALEPQDVPRPAVSAPKIAPDDPIIEHFQNGSGIADVDELDMDSPALRAMKRAGVRVVVPLISQGELVGLLNLGPRLSHQEYSADDRKLLSDLSTQAAPAIRVAQLVRQRQAEARERGRIEQELRVARLIQQTLLPKALPELPGWQVEAHYQPAREVGGDFYDFLTLPGGRLGVVVGDVTGEGVPAALVMATTRSVMRGAAQRSNSPGRVLQRANELLRPDVPSNMFVTCLYAILDPDNGYLRYANAGHNLPYLRHGDSVVELRATGMPLGLMTGTNYEEKEARLQPGDSVLFYSDGLIEAHNPRREMFGFSRLRELLAENTVGGAALIGFLLAKLARFTGDNKEQEDDITLVTLQRSEAHDHS